MNMRSMAIITTSVALLTGSQAVFSSPDLDNVVIEQVGYAGNGCPEGSASVVLASDKKSVSFSFDAFIAEAGGNGQRTFERQKCDVAFGLKIPEGVSVSLVDADYNGFSNLPIGAKATFTRDYFFAGTRGPRLTKTWQGEHKESFQIKDRLGDFENRWSGCGADVILRSKAAITVRTKRGHEASMLLDTLSCPAPPTAARYHFRYKSC